MVVILLIAFFALIVYYVVSEGKSKKVSEYHKQNQKLTDKGSSTQNYNVAKNCLSDLESGYHEIKDYVGSNSRSCYEDDIVEVRSNIESIVFDKWDSKTHSILAKIEEKYGLLMNCTFSDVEEAYRAQSQILKLYDSYWDYTREFYEEHVGDLVHIRIWDEARDKMKFILGEDEGFTFWGNGQSAQVSVREQLNKKITARIEEIRPEYTRKKDIMEKLLVRIYDETNVMRCELMKMQEFSKYNPKEVQACYRALLKVKKIVEYKVENRYFVCLSDKEAAKRENTTKKCVQA